MRPSPEQIRRASKDVAWEYATLLASALEIAKGPRAPINHLVQETFLVHTRNLAEFFRGGIQEFARNGELPNRRQSQIYAVDFCQSVRWDPRPFSESTTLIKAINRSVSHMTYSRDRSSKGHVYFEGYLHAHGTVRLVSRTWAKFMSSVKPQLQQPECPQDINYWLGEHTREWDVKFSELGSKFEESAKQWSHWKFDQTSDGPV